MFVLTKKTSFWWPVVLKSPQDGKYVEEKINLHLKVLDDDEISKVKEMDAPHFARSVIIDWKDVVTDLNRPVEFTPEALDRLLKQTGIPMQIFNQYFEILKGTIEKN